MTRFAVVGVLLAGGLLAVVPATWPVATPILAAAALFLLLRLAHWFRRLAQATEIGRLQAMTPAHFEREVGSWFARAGFVVEHRGGKGDHGIDLLAFDGDTLVAVQCKRYATGRAVTPAQVRELYGAATAVGASHALLVTTGRYTAAASSWATSLAGEPYLVLLGPGELVPFGESPRGHLAAP